MSKKTSVAVGLAAWCVQTALGMLNVYNQVVGSILFGIGIGAFAWAGIKSKWAMTYARSVGWKRDSQQLIAKCIPAIIGIIAAVAIYPFDLTRGFSAVRDAIGLKEDFVALKIPGPKPHDPFVTVILNANPSREISFGGRPKWLHVDPPGITITAEGPFPSVFKINQGEFRILAFTDRGFVIDEGNIRDASIRVYRLD